MIVSHLIKASLKGKNLQAERDVSYMDENRKSQKLLSFEKKLLKHVPLHYKDPQCLMEFMVMILHLTFMFMCIIEIILETV